MKKIGFIGAGNMAGALIKGLIGAELYTAQDILVSDAMPAQLTKIKRAYKVEGLRDNTTLVQTAQTIVLSVKPQILDRVMAEIQPSVTKQHVCISIAAGASLKRLENGLGGMARVIRVMPNTPALLGKGMAVVTRGKKATAQDEKLALSLFRGVGEATAVKDEGLMDAVTGLSGSGPAYVYLFAEALIEGGVKAGLSQKMATQLALQTLTGAAAMLQEAGQTPQVLREMVSSPGGTTVAGLARLNKGNFVKTIVAGIDAATRRSRALGKG